MIFPIPVFLYVIILYFSLNLKITQKQCQEGEKKKSAKKKKSLILGLVLVPPANDFLLAVDHSVRKGLCALLEVGLETGFKAYEFFANERGNLVYIFLTCLDVALLVRDLPAGIQGDIGLVLGNELIEASLLLLQLRASVLELKDVAVAGGKDLPHRLEQADVFVDEQTKVVCVLPG